jgi:hypothetical protein
VILHDPIRDALRQLVREKRIQGWNARATPVGVEWTVSFENATRVLDTDAVNDLVGMFWQT